MTDASPSNGSPRILLANFGSSGDINPLVALAIRLRAHGYSPILAASAEYRDKAEREHIGFAPVGPGLSEIIGAFGARPQEDRLGVDTEDDFARVLRMVVMPHLEQSFAQASEAIRGAALVIAGPFAAGARLAAIHSGIPWLSLALQPAAFLPTTWRQAMNHCGPELELRKRLGIAEERGTRSWHEVFSPRGTIALYSRLLHVEAELPPRTEAVGFAFYDRAISGAEGLPVPLTRFLDAGLPPLVFTTGSWIPGSARSFFQHSAAVARVLNRRAILLTGAHGEGTMLAPDILACGYAPYSQLFKRAEAVVHHGGIGTVAQALSAGCRQLVVPFFFDQFDNADRLVALKVARQVAATQYDVRMAAEEVSKLLHTPHYKIRAAEVAGSIGEEDGPAKVLRIVDGVLRS